MDFFTDGILPLNENNNISNDNNDKNITNLKTGHACQQNNMLLNVPLLGISVRDKLSAEEKLSKS